MKVQLSIVSVDKEGFVGQSSILEKIKEDMVENISITKEKKRKKRKDKKRKKSNHQSFLPFYQNKYNKIQQLLHYNLQFLH